MKVRPACGGDELGIARIHVLTWQTAYRGLIPDTILEGLSVERRTAMWRRIISESVLPKNGAFVLIGDDDEISGFVHVSPSRDDDASDEVGEITGLYVSPALWRRGGGSLLMERAVESLCAAGFVQASLWVLDTNTRARRFYEGGGWSADGLMKHDDRGTFRMVEVRYRRVIASA